MQSIPSCLYLAPAQTFYGLSQLRLNRSNYTCVSVLLRTVVPLENRYKQNCYFESSSYSHFLCYNLM
uniref:Uncharacterized protein n=1 Tax=Anguilla anguilla TaxID=7936 RepID=A0A0E9XV18_ANGAN